MLYHKELVKVDVLEDLDGLENVVKKVEWNIIFEDENTGVTSQASIHTVLSNPNPDTFTDISNLTKTDILNWATTTQGGDVFIEKLKALHQDEILYKNQLIGVVEYDINNLGD